MQPERQNKLGAMPMEKLLLSMSLPLIVSMLVQSMYNIVDGIYVAQISEGALTATTLAWPVQMLMISVAGGTGVGINSLLSRRLGQKRYEEANAVATNGLFLAVCSSLVFVVFGLFFARPFIAAFTDDLTIVEMGTDYLSLCCTLSFGIFLALTGERLLQATGRSLFSMIAQLTGAVTNIILDPIFIFGRYGMPEMGLRGAAVATVIGQILGAVVALVFNAVLNHDIHFRLRGFRPDGAIIGGIYRVGLPSVIMQSIGSVMSIGMNAILIAVSSTYVAVLGVYVKLQSFVFMPVFGLTQGLIPIIGFNYGAKNVPRVKKAIQLGLVTSAAIMLAGTLLFHLIPDRLMLLFEAGDDMLAIGVPALRIISLSFMMASVTIVISSAFQGMGNGMLSLANSFTRQLVILLPTAYLLSRLVGADAVWFAYPIAEAVAFIITLIFFARTYRKYIRPLEQPAG